MLGEMIYDVVDHSIRPLLNPELTASWEKGLTYVAEGDITSDEYMKKLDDFVSRRTLAVKRLNNQYRVMIRQHSFIRSRQERPEKLKNKKGEPTC